MFSDFKRELNITYYIIFLDYTSNYYTYSNPNILKSEKKSISYNIIHRNPIPIMMGKNGEFKNFNFFFGEIYPVYTLIVGLGLGNY